MPQVKSNLNEPLDCPGTTWFEGEAGQCLIRAEKTAMDALLAAQPAAPWLWLGVCGAEPPADVPYGIELRRTVRNLNAAAQNIATIPPNAQDFRGDDPRTGFTGDVHCDLPLPFASESFGTILIQHALDDGRDWHLILSECDRLLIPGGTLWLACVNPWSPYRLRSLRHGVHAQSPTRWQRYLRAAGFAAATTALQWLGPHWRVNPSGSASSGIGSLDVSRAAFVLTARKQTLARIRGTPVRSLLKPAVVTAARGNAASEVATVMAPELAEKR